MLETTLTYPLTMSCRSLAWSGHCQTSTSLSHCSTRSKSSLTDFCHCARKQAATVKLCKTTTTTHQPKVQQMQCTTNSNTSTTSNNDSWHETPNPAEDNDKRYGFGTNLYDTISAHPKIESNHNRQEHFLDKLELEYINIIKKLCKMDTRIIPDCNQTLARYLQLLSEVPNGTLVQSDKTGQWIPIRIIDYIDEMKIHLNHCCH
jgi:hypothetical protein